MALYFVVVALWFAYGCPMLASFELVQNSPLNSRNDKFLELGI